MLRYTLLRLLVFFGSCPCCGCSGCATRTSSCCCSSSARPALRGHLLLRAAPVPRGATGGSAALERRSAAKQAGTARRRRGRRGRRGRAPDGRVPLRPSPPKRNPPPPLSSPHPHPLATPSLFPDPSIPPLTPSPLPLAFRPPPSSLPTPPSLSPSPVLPPLLPSPRPLLPCSLSPPPYRLRSTQGERLAVIPSASDGIRDLEEPGGREHRDEVAPRRPGAQRLQGLPEQAEGQQAQQRHG